MVGNVATQSEKLILFSVIDPFVGCVYAYVEGQCQWSEHTNNTFYSARQPTNNMHWEKDNIPANQKSCHRSGLIASIQSECAHAAHHRHTFEMNEDERKIKEDEHC